MATTKTIQPTGTTITIPAMTDRPDASVFATDVDRITDATNALNRNFTFNPQLNSEMVSTATMQGIRYGKLCKISFSINVAVAGEAWTTVATIPEGYRPGITQFGICAIDSTISAGGGQIAEIRIASTGELQIYAPIATLYWGGIEYICS